MCQVSEGLDFADHAGRAVVITGLPFATRNDPKVIISPILPSEYFSMCILSRSWLLKKVEIGTTNKEVEMENGDFIKHF